MNAQRKSTVLSATLWGVAALVAYFSLQNVTAFAVEHGTPFRTAVVLAPMVDIALVAALVGDGALSRAGVRPTGWGTTLRWFAGIATLAFNVWESVARQDAAAIVLHAVPPLLLILLAEAAPQYHRQFAALADQAADQADQSTVTSLVTDPGQPAMVDQPAGGILTSRPAADLGVDQRSDQLVTVTGQPDQGLASADQADIEADMRPDIEADMRPDIPADTVADTEPDIRRTSERTRSRTTARTSGRTSRPDTATAVARMSARHPDWSSADIARRLGVTDRTVRRHLSSGQSTPTLHAVNDA